MTKNQKNTEFGQYPETSGKGYDIAIVIGTVHYPTPEDFVVEAQRAGVSRRLRVAAPMIKQGETRCWCFHRDGLKEGLRLIGYFTIDKVEKLVFNPTDPEALSKIETTRGVLPVSYFGAHTSESPRGCGRRQVNGIYLRGNFTRTMGYVISPCLKFFRGYIRVLREDMLAQLHKAHERGLYPVNVGSKPCGFWG